MPTSPNQGSALRLRGLGLQLDRLAGCCFPAVSSATSWILQHGYTQQFLGNWQLFFSFILSSLDWCPLELDVLFSGMRIAIRVHTQTPFLEPFLISVKPTKQTLKHVVPHKNYLSWSYTDDWK